MIAVLNMNCLDGILSKLLPGYVKRACARWCHGKTERYLLSGLVSG